MSDSIPRPQKVEANNYTFTIYQPQIENWKGKEVERRVLNGMLRTQPISHTQLFRVRTSTNDLLFNTGGRKCYLRLNGRWLVAPTPDGPWNFLSSDALPPDFAKITVTHPRADIPAPAAGTPQARGVF